MMSPMMVNVWITLGAAFQCLLIMWARRLPLDHWKAVLVTALGVPAFMVFWVTFTGGRGSGFAGLVPVYGVLGAALALLILAPPRVSAAAVLSISVTFWAAYWPEAPRTPLWLFFAGPLTFVALVYASSSFVPGRFARLVLYVWYIVAAAALARVGLARRDLGIAFSDAAVRSDPLHLAMMGAQVLLFMSAAISLILLLPITADVPRKKAARATRIPFGELPFGELLIAGFDAANKPGWRGLVVIAAQALALGALRRSEPSMQSEAIRMAAFAAMAHGAMSGGPKPSTSKKRA
jgi:hypothetical protein